MPDETEEVLVPIVVPKTNIDLLIAQAVVDSKLGDLIEAAIKSALGNEWTVKQEIEGIVKTQIRSEIQRTLTFPEAREAHDGELPADHPAVILRDRITEGVRAFLSDDANLQKLVNNALRTY